MSARDHIQRHPSGADIERKNQARGDRAEAAVTLLVCVFLSVIIALSLVHWMESADMGPVIIKVQGTESGGAA